MPLPIGDDAGTTRDTRIRGFDVARCQIGDRFAARITGFTSSGRAWLQFGGFKALSVQPLAGRAGEVLQFEVAARTGSTGTAPISGAVPGGAATSLDSVRWLQLDLPQGGKIVRLPVFLKCIPERAQTPVHSPPAASRPPAEIPFDVPAVLRSAIPVSLTPSLWAWFERYRKCVRHGATTARASSSPLGGITLSEGAGSARRSHPLDPPLPEAPEGPLSTQPYAGEFQLGGIPVRFWLRQGRGQEGQSAVSRSVEAAIVLWMEHAGPVRADIQMGGDSLRVTLAVGHDGCRQFLREALPDLEAALAPLAARCQCRVDARAFNGIGFEEGGASAETAG